MKQLESLSYLKPLIQSFPGIQGALLIGSFARNTPKWNSDVDLSFWVDSSFDPHNFISKAHELFGAAFRFGLYSAYRHHLTVYFTDRPKVDISLSASMEGLDRNFLGSEIQDLDNSVLWDLQGVLRDHLIAISKGRVAGGISDYAREVHLLMEKFLFDFEQFSESHRRSDAYKSYFFYNIALNGAIQIRYLARGGRAFSFLPKNFSTSVLSRDEDQQFRELAGTLYLPEVNSLKRRLTDFFLKSLQESGVVNEERLEEIQAFCEFVYERDFIWNFRDLAEINPRLKAGLIFRSSSLTRYQSEAFFPDYLSSKKIAQIIDLRDEAELTQNPYDPERIGAVRYIHIPIDPRIQSDHFRTDYHGGTPAEIAYRYFAVECKSQIRQLFEELVEAEEAATVIHCHAGKDRTGALVTLIHLLSGAEEAVIQRDYLASEMDTNLTLLNAFCEIIDQSGGIRPYLYSCGIAPSVVDALQSKILKPTVL